MVHVLASLMLHPWLPTLSPDSAVILGSIGFCLIFLELNRPGSILPGAFGMLLLLYAVYALSDEKLKPWAVALLVVATMLLVLNLWYRLPSWSLVLATLGLCTGFRCMLPTEVTRVSLETSVLCGLVLGALGAVLSRVAYRARRAKRVN